jgi:toxin FitB
MEQGQVIALDSRLAIDAAYYGLKHKLPLVDSIIYATAMKHDAIIWTQDNDFESLNNVKYFPKLGKT